MLVEPELITIGDGVCVNNQCSIICHLNTRGAFSLGAIAVGARNTARLDGELVSSGPPCATEIPGRVTKRPFTRRGFLWSC